MPDVETAIARVAERVHLTTDSNHDFPVAPNRLDQQFVAQKPNQIWLTDFTYIPTEEGFTYLCVILDLYSRKIVGWSTSTKIDSELALSALIQAVILRSSKGLMIHSDRGSQYASLAFEQCLSKYGLVQSMSRRGNCYDNAPIESFYKSFKVEEVYRQKYRTHEQATRAVADYIERFYNRTRLHSYTWLFQPGRIRKATSVGSQRCGLKLGSGGVWVGRSPRRSDSGAYGDQPMRRNEPIFEKKTRQVELHIGQE